MIRIAKNAAIVVGRVGMDAYPDPPGSKTAAATSLYVCMGGSSANIAAALVRHGGAAALVTRVSDDAVGRYCLGQLDHYGVDRTHVRIAAGDSDARTSLAIVETTLIDHQSVIYRNNAADLQMTVADVAAVDYARYGVFICTGTALNADPSRTATLRALALAGEAGLPRVIDLDYRPYGWPDPQEAARIYAAAADSCEIVIGNDVEFGVLAGAYDAGLDAARALAARGKIAVYKMGEKGALTLTPEGEIRTGVYRVDALKPTGAGDAFMGGFVAGLASGRDLETAVLRGSACAAIVVTRVGCAPAMPTAAELDAFIAQHSGPTSD